jgi:hypothetical protein
LEWLYHLRVTLWLVEGEERHSRQPLCVLCALSGITRNYVLDMMFAEGYRRRRAGRYWLWNLSRAIKAVAPDCSMILVWMSESHFQRFTRPSNWFLLPEWVLGEVALPRDATATRKVRGDLQKIRHHALGFEVTHDPRQFDDFYHHMYVPYASQTFGNHAYVYSHKVLRSGFRDGELLLVVKDEKSVAGQLIIYEEATPHLFVMGVRDGDREAVRTGAGGSAVFHFSLQYLQEKGYKNALLGWSRPFLRSGVLRFKQRWSQVITDNSYAGIGLMISSLTPAARSFLCNNPFIFSRDDRLYAAVFVNAGEPLALEQVEQTTRDYFHDGLAGLMIYRLPTDGATALTPLTVGLPEHVELHAWPL